MNMIVIAHDIRSLHNVGSIFRNCAAFGVEKLYLTGITGLPPRKEISKVALGAQDLVAWEAGDVFEIIQRLKTEGFLVCALETGNDAEEIGRFSTKQPVALILGNEVEGIAPDVLEVVDQKLVIPMQRKRSLNVSVASGVALYALTN